jgi:hypothetical protein
MAKGSGSALLRSLSRDHHRRPADRGNAPEPAMSDAPRCSWCDRTFRPRQGGRAQRFCRPSCRRAFHAAARSWVLAGLAAGHIAISDVKNGPLATRALPGSAISPFPTHEGPPPQPASAEGQDCLPDDFGVLLDEMDEILGEPTIPLLVRLRWLAGDRQKDRAALVRGLCRFFGHVLDMTRNVRP